jgi:hypothetical protein
MPNSIRVVARLFAVTASAAHAGTVCREEAAKLARTQVESILDDPSCAAARVIEDDLQNLSTSPGFFVLVECGKHQGFSKWLQVSTRYVEAGWCRATRAVVVSGDPEAEQEARRKEIARRIELASKPYALDCKSRYGAKTRVIELNARPGLSFIDGEPARSRVSASSSDYSWALSTASGSSNGYGLKSFSLRSKDLRSATATESGRIDCSGQNPPGSHPTCTEPYDDDLDCRFRQ